MDSRPLPRAQSLTVAPRFDPVSAVTTPEATVDPFAADTPPELNEVRAGEDLDWARIEAYLRAELPDDLDIDGDFTVLQFPNGAANLTYMIRFGTTELVLRRPPHGTLAPGAHDMRREHKVLSVLWQVFDKAPRAYVFCDDHEIAGADFFVMERCRGEVIRGVIPKSMRDQPDVGRRAGFALVDAIAEFHLLDPYDVGLGDLGRPDGFVARQVSGWKKRWGLVADARYDAAMSSIHARLERSMPAPQRVSFVHNDLKLDNCMFAPGQPDQLISFFDWDMTTLGDPLIDIGTLLNYWPEADDAPDSPRLSHDGMQRMGLPSRADIAERYSEQSGLDVSFAPWYDAFAQWKTATVIQQLHHRWLVGASTDPRMEFVAARLPHLVEGATVLLDNLGA